MNTREQIISEVKILDESRLKEIAEYIDFLKFRERQKLRKPINSSLNDSIHNLGKNPVETGVNDASENPDKYLY